MSFCNKKICCQMLVTVNNNNAHSIKDFIFHEGRIFLFSIEYNLYRL